MARRVRSLREMREMAEAAEARGLLTPEGKAREGRRPRDEEQEKGRTTRPRSQPRMKIVWSVCDLGGRTIQQFEYPQKAEAEALAAELIEKGKGHHFVRSEKVPMTPGS